MEAASALARAEYSPRTGSRFYFDLQYTRVDGIYQNITTVIGQNYSRELLPS